MEIYRCNRREALLIAGVVTAGAVLTACRVAETPPLPVESAPLGPESPFQRRVICTQSLSGVIKTVPNDLLPDDTMSIRQLVLGCEGSTYTINLLDHSIYPLPDERSIQIWSELENGDCTPETKFTWDRDHSGNILMGFESNCAATVFRMIGMNIPVGNQVMTTDPRELLNVLRGFNNPYAPNGHAPGIGVEMRVFSEGEFNSNPSSIMAGMQAGDIAYFISRDNEGNEDHHIGICLIDTGTEELTLYQKISIVGPSGYGSPEALKYLLGNWKTVDGVPFPSKIIEVHIIRPNFTFQTLPIINTPISMIIEPRKSDISQRKFRYYDLREVGAYGINLSTRCEHISYTTVASIIRYFCAQMVS